MRNKQTPERVGVVLDVDVTFGFGEFCRVCGVRAEYVTEMVQEGVIEPMGRRPEEWRFNGKTLVRARRALRLVRDLGVNWAGAALALDLLERLERQHLSVNRLSRRL